MRFDGQPVPAQRVPGGQLGPEVHRHPGGAVRQRRDAVAGQAAHPDTARGTRHVLRPVAGHHRQPHGVQGVQPGVPHHVPVHRPHAADRAELRLRGGRAAAVGAHRPAHVRPGEHTAVRPREPVQAQPEAEAPAGAGAPAPGQIEHLAAVLLRAHHQRRGVRPVPVPVAAEPGGGHPEDGAAGGHRRRHRGRRRTVNGRRAQLAPRLVGAPPPAPRRNRPSSLAIRSTCPPRIFPFTRHFHQITFFFCFFKE